jgi:hypothetical protein
VIRTLISGPGIIATVFLVIASSAQGADAKAAQTSYEKQGRELLAAINSGKVDIETARKNVEGMVQSADVLFEAFATKHPESKKLYEYMKANLSKVKAASFEVLEKDYHDAGILTPKLVGVDLKSEEGEQYTDPLHTLLHPLMTLKAIEKNDLKSAKEELNEGLEQVKNTAKSVLK